MKITRVETVPLALPVPRARVSLADPQLPQSTPLIAVRLQTDDGQAGLGFTTTPIGASALHALIAGELSAIVSGEDAIDTERLFARAQGRFRAAGWAGLAARAYAAIDIA